MQNKARLLFFLALIKFILPFILVNSYYQLHRDEYLYLAEGHHLTWISDHLGAGIFWTRFWPALFGSLIFLLTAKMIFSLGGGQLRKRAKSFLFENPGPSFI
jgi:hypothetical protein